MTKDKEKYEAITPEMAQMLERRAKCNVFAQYLGIKIVENRKGYSKCELEIREEFLNPSHTVHGGCIYTLADVTVGNAAAAYGYAAPTLEAGLHYLAAAKGVEKLHAVAKEIHHGRPVMVFSVDVSDGQGKIFASGPFSFFNTGMPLSF